MPVRDHEVHPSTKIGPEHRAGCWIGPDETSRRKNWYWVKADMLVSRFSNTPHKAAGELLLVNQHDNMSKHCRQIDYDKLPECQGCCAVKDMAYIEEMLALTRKERNA